MYSSLSSMRAVLAALLYVLVIGARTASADQLSDALAAVEQRFEQLRDVRIEFELQESFTPANGDPQMYKDLKEAQGRDLGGHVKLGRMMEGDFTKKCVWRRFQDCVRLERIDVGAPDPVGNFVEIASAYDKRVDMRVVMRPIRQPDIQEVLVAPIHWAIAPRVADPSAWIDESLGLRLDSAEKLLTLAELRGLEVVNCNADSLTLARLDRRKLHLLRFSEKFGWALENYRVLNDGRVAEETQCEDFRQVNGTWMPHRTTKRRNSTFEGAIGPVQQQTVVVSKIEFAPQDGGRESFPLVFPNGAMVSDLASGLGFKSVSGDQTISDEKLASRIEAYRRFEQEAQERISKGWQPTEQELNELMAKHVKSTTK